MAFSFKGLILLLVILIAASVLFSTFFKKRLTDFLEPKKGDYTISTSVTPAPEITTEVADVHSPDGKMKLIMEKTNSKGLSTYTFFVSDIAGEEKIAVFSKTLPQKSTIQISQNSFSPDNKYLFLKEESSGLVNYLVFKTTGEAFSDEEQYISVVPLFVAKKTQYNLSDVTGWDSSTLLHVFTTKEGGAQGPSFWFELPSKAIIQLASR